MELIDQIEQLGAAVDADLLAPGAAAQQLQEYSDGGLTRLEAADMLGRWQMARAEYTAIRERARQSLRRLGCDPDAPWGDRDVLRARAARIAVALDCDPDAPWGR